MKELSYIFLTFIIVFMFFQIRFVFKNILYSKKLIRIYTNQIKNTKTKLHLHKIYNDLCSDVLSPDKTEISVSLPKKIKKLFDLIEEKEKELNK